MKITPEEHALWLYVNKINGTVPLGVSSSTTYKAQPNSELNSVIDLHGYSINEAHKIVNEYIELCHRHKKKEIIIITGKGSLNETSIRRELPFWLEDSSISHHIISHNLISNGGAYKIKIRTKSS